jgi:phospholipase/carboxylesterase
MVAFRAMRQLPRALEALYPLARDLLPVNRFFLDPALRDDDKLTWRLESAEVRDDTGVIHVDNAAGTRGGYSIYVPEYYTPDRAWPVVFALHGGSGHGRSFLWSWLRDCRSRGAILVSPTATGQTWALQGDDIDTPNLVRMLDHVRSRWRIDESRALMTGLSDGGTFSYVSGLERGSPFTHLAPVAAAFHPLLAEFADPGRLKGLPLFIVHGKLDWMFPVEMARQAEAYFTKAGADVTYREIDDLSHTYPREINAEMLAWLGERSDGVSLA